MTLDDIKSAAQAISGLAFKTPLKPSHYLSALLGRQVFIKLETAQPIGSFKIRGAANKILSLPHQDRQKGVVAASSGNHGRAVAFVAKSLGILATIFVSRHVPAYKAAQIRILGAEVIVFGAEEVEAVAEAEAFSTRRGAAFIPAFDDPDIIAGQGTIGLEIFDQCPNTECIISPVGGGGLAAGIAVAAKSLAPTVHVCGTSMAEGASMFQSLKAGKPIFVSEADSIADGLQGGIGLTNTCSFNICRDLLDSFKLQSERSIKQAMALAFEHEHLVLEGAAATGIAALIEHGDDIPGKNVAIICTGDNIDPETWLATIRQYRSKQGPG